MTDVLLRLRSLGPGVVISVSLHALLLAILVVVCFRELRSDDTALAPPGYVIGCPPPAAAVEPPRVEIERYGIPKNEVVEVVPGHPEAAATTGLDASAATDVSVTVDGGSGEFGDRQLGDGDTFTSSLLGDVAGKGATIGVGGGSRRPGRRGGQFPGRQGGLRMGEPNRASQKTEAAVLYGLTWLARHQMPNGSWDAVAYQDRCVDGSCAGSGHVRFSDGLTGLALLAFLGAGYAHDSHQFITDPKTGASISLGAVVKNGLHALIDRQQPDGSFGSDTYMYNQAICAMALCEAYGLTGARFFREPAARAIGFLQSAQSSDPSGTGYLGWRYAPRGGDADTSVTGWCVMALKSAELAGLPVNSSSLDGGLKWVSLCTNADGKTGYLSAGDAGQKIVNPEEQGQFDHHDSMTAAAMVVRTFTTFDWRDPSMDRGASHLSADLPTWEPARKRDYYYWYYASLALNQFAGPDSPNPNKTAWARWNERLVQALVPHQENVAMIERGERHGESYRQLFADAGAAACKTGSFPPNDRYGYAGRIYATAINVLTLEVYYRFENAFGRGKMPRGAKH